MSHTISQPPVTEVWQTTIALIVVSLGIVIAVRQTWQIREGCRWWQPIVLWIVPVVFACLQLVTASPAGTMRFGWSPWVLLGSLIWGAIVTIQSRRVVKAAWPVKAWSLLLSIAGGLMVTAGLLSPALFAARNAAWRTSHNCSLKIVGLAMHNYHDVYKTFPMPAAGDPPSSWRVAVLPYVDEAALYGRYRFDAAWDSEENLPIARTAQRTCHRRDDDNWRDPLGRYYCYFAMITGPGTIWENDQPMAVEDITDGTSNTILAGEAAGWKLIWTEPRDVDVRQATWDINRPGPTPDVSHSLLSSPLEGGAYVLLGDGSVRFLSNKIDSQTLKALVSPRGRDKVGEF